MTGARLNGENRGVDAGLLKEEVATASKRRICTNHARASKTKQLWGITDEVLAVSPRSLRKSQALDEVSREQC